MYSSRIIAYLKLHTDTHSHTEVQIVIGDCTYFVVPCKKISTFFFNGKMRTGRHAIILTFISGNCSKVRTRSFSFPVWKRKVCKYSCLWLA